METERPQPLGIRAVHAQDRISSAAASIDAFLGLLQSSGDEWLEFTKASSLWFLLQPVREHLEEANKLLDQSGQCSI